MCTVCEMHGHTCVHTGARVGACTAAEGHGMRVHVCVHLHVHGAPRMMLLSEEV